MRQSGVGEQFRHFLDLNPREFGLLLQRDRNLQRLPGPRPRLRTGGRAYWIEPHEGWGEGRVEQSIADPPTRNNDNIVAAWKASRRMGSTAWRSRWPTATSITSHRDGSEPDAGRPHRRDASASRRARWGRPGSAAAARCGTRFLIDLSRAATSYYMRLTPSLVQINGRHPPRPRAGSCAPFDSSPTRIQLLGAPRRRSTSRYDPGQSEFRPAGLPARRPEGADGRTWTLSLAGVSCFTAAVC